MEWVWMAGEVRKEWEELRDSELHSGYIVLEKNLPFNKRDKLKEKN